MSEAKHTPGPWKVIDIPNADGIGIIPAKRPPGVKAREVEDIASISKSNEQGGDPHANARLIAAAPELLAALEWVATHAYAGGKTFGDTPIVKAALKKAKGQ